ncbi:unnamed protein product [Meganyctiphanes norvegica]|uniref:ATP synthase subunit d, mitochondrial n=1 Tax=Meganyctiphanes norvegica TaxID=48144 RepID=A0AAV2PW61_MEGNR
MAARRIAASAINWGEFAARVPANQKGAFNAFKGKSEAHLRAVLTKPEALPAIDFSAYAARISVPGMVESFQKQYESIAIPYPEDTVSGAIDEQEAAAAVEVKEFVAESAARIGTLEGDLAHWSGMIPYDQMTMEEWAVAFPEQTISVDNPSMWPHKPEDQPGYVAPDAAAEAAH